MVYNWRNSQIPRLNTSNHWCSVASIHNLHSTVRHTATDLTLGADAHVSDDGAVAAGGAGSERLLDAQVRQHILAKDRLGVQIRRHEATVSGHRL